MSAACDRLADARLSPRWSPPPSGRSRPTASSSPGSRSTSASTSSRATSRTSPHRPRALRRARRRDTTAVLDIDAAAFSAFWRLDEAGIDEALDRHPRQPVPGGRRPVVGRRASPATPCAGGPAAAGSCSVSPSTPCEQAAASVEPSCSTGSAGCGGAASSGWSSTPRRPTPGRLRLYERLGFRRQPGGLAVLKKTL